MSNKITPQINSVWADTTPDQRARPKKEATHNSDEPFHPDSELLSIGYQLSMAESLYERGYSADEAHRIAAEEAYRLAAECYK